MTKYAWSWDQETASWSLAADSRYQVLDFKFSHPYYEMRIDGVKVDNANSADAAFTALEARYEYEEHAADLEEARLRLSQAGRRLAERFPRAARDPHLASILSWLRDALGAGPEASEPQASAVGSTDLYRRHVAPDLAVVLDASCCVVLEVTREGKTQRRITLGDVRLLCGSLDEALGMRDAVEKQAERDRYAGPRERAKSEGRYAQTEAVDELIRLGYPRHLAIGATQRIRAAHQRWYEHFPNAKPADFGDAERIRVAGKTFLVGYDGSHWTVQLATETSDAEQS